MRSHFTVRHRRVLAVLGACWLAFSSVGCQQDEEIRHYRVPKPTSVAADSDLPAAPMAHAPAQGRMLGAMILTGDRAWYFKVVGPDQQIGTHAADFRSLIESVRFADDKPAWDLPDGWQQKPGSGMRFATLEFGPEQEPLELSVIPLGVPDGDSAACVLSNVNRWRGQMGLPPITADQLGDETVQLDLDGVTATLVDLQVGVE